jgi:hypothetical protein
VEGREDGERDRRGGESDSDSVSNSLCVSCAEEEVQ